MFNILRMVGAVAVVVVIATAPVMAETPTYTIQIKDHRFIPETLNIPAGTKVKLIIENLDKTAEEFESFDLNREKIVLGGKKIKIFLPPLEPGEYGFFGEFNPKTAQGKVIVK